MARTAVISTTGTGPTDHIEVAQEGPLLITFSSTGSATLQGGFDPDFGDVYDSSGVVTLTATRGVNVARGHYRLSIASNAGTITMRAL